MRKQARQRHAKGIHSCPATLIRHAQRGPTKPVLPLPVTVIQAPLRATLVSPIGRAPLLPPRLIPTSPGAIPLAPVAGPAHVEHTPALRASAKTLSERDFFGSQHRPRKAGLDIWPPSWEAQIAPCEASLLRRSHTKPRPSAKTTGVSFLRLPVESLARYTQRAFGADDAETVPRQQENRSFRRAPTKLHGSDLRLGHRGAVGAQKEPVGAEKPAKNPLKVHMKLSNGGRATSRGGIWSSGGKLWRSRRSRVVRAHSLPSHSHLVAPG